MNMLLAHLSNANGPLRYFNLPIEIRYNILEFHFVRRNHGPDIRGINEAAVRHWDHTRPN